jgi:hypothetical protein
MTSVLLDAVVYRSVDGSVGIEQAGSSTFKIKLQSPSRIKSW